jgi:hypothetical protein
MRFLANENFPLVAVEALRAAGREGVWAFRVPRFRWWRPEPQLFPRRRRSNSKEEKNRIFLD